MSSHAVSHALRRRTGSPSLKVVLLILSEYADEFGRVVITQKRLADESDLCTRSVAAALKALEDMGAIMRTRQVNSKGHRAPDLITIVGVAPVEVQPMDVRPATLNAIDACGSNMQDAHSGRPYMQQTHVRQTHLRSLHVGEKPMGRNDSSLGAGDASRRNSEVPMEIYKPSTEINTLPPHSESVETKNSSEPTKPRPRRTSRRNAEARRLWNELRPLLSETGRARTKPAELDRRLAPIIEEHGFEITFRAARAFYRHRERQKEDGAFQPGFQSICNDGRLVEAIEYLKAKPAKQGDGPAPDAVFIDGRWSDA